jgi:hypothetical protein
MTVKGDPAARRGRRVTRFETVTLTTRVCSRVRLPHASGKRILICQ